MRSYYSREERQKIVEEYIQSGKSQTVFAPREFASKTESLKKLYESQPFLFDAEEMGLKLENQCPEISDEDIAQALNDDDLFDRKSERKKPGRTRNKSYTGLKRIIVCTNSNLVAPKNYESVGFKLYDRKANVTESAYTGDYLYYEIVLQ